MHLIRSTALAALCCASSSVFAIANGVYPADGLIRNPFTGAEITAWKLVGTAGASAFQIHRNWILASRHGNPAGGTFANHLGTSGIGQCFNGNDAPDSSYYATGPNDFVLCRLTQPAQIADYGTYPALVAAPTAVINASGIYNQFNVKYGAIMGYGYGWSSAQLAIVDFAGLPYGYQPALGANAGPIPYNVGGDSGSAAYWISPTASAPAVIGVITGGALVPAGITYLSQQSVTWIRDKIAQAGDTPPVILTDTQHYTGPTGNPAPELTSTPTLNLGGATPAVSWLTPSGTDGQSITSYQVTLGRNGAIDRTATVAAGSGNTLALTNLLAQTDYMVCVQPRNSVGPSRAAQPVQYQAFTEPVVLTPNCRKFSTRAPGMASNPAQTASYSTATGLYTVNLSWSAPAPVTGVTVAKYRVTRAITYPNGPKRSTTNDVTGLSSNSIALPAGSTVCSSVAAISDVGILGTATTQVCTTAR